MRVKEENADMMSTLSAHGKSNPRIANPPKTASTQDLETTCCVCWCCRKRKRETGNVRSSRNRKASVRRAHQNSQPYIRIRITTPYQKRIGGLVVKSIVAIDGPRVRFTVDADASPPKRGSLLLILPFPPSSPLADSNYWTSCLSSL